MTHASWYPPRLLKSWVNEVVVFDSASCNTHYVKPLTLMLCQTCRGFPDCSSTVHGVADTPQFHDLTEEILNSLRKIGLLESA